jgi:uncharacterized membrane protein YphA (DoxX/SURF4 family)
LETVGPVCALGSSDLEQYALLLVRVSLGLFFAISGANKLFVAGGAKTIWLICSGPGKFSVDYWLAGKLLR